MTADPHDKEGEPMPVPDDKGGAGADDAIDMAMADAERQAALPVRTEHLPPRGFTAILLLITSVIPAVGLAIVAVTAGAGPELLADAPGGLLEVRAGPMCAATVTAECFERVNVTVTYASGEEEEMPLDEGFYAMGAHQLDEARARVLVSTEKGSWTREVWIPEGDSAGLLFRPGVETDLDVLGRDGEAAFWYGSGALVATVIAVSTAVWWAKGSLLAALFARGSTTLAVLMQATLVGVAAYQWRWEYGGTFFAVWMLWVRSRLSTWVKVAQGKVPPAPSGGV